MDTEPHLQRLLLWLADELVRQPGETAESAGYAAVELLPETTVEDLACTLELRGQAALSRNLARTTPGILLTEAGLTEARRLRASQQDPVQPVRYSRDAIVNWLFPLRRSGPVSIGAFLSTAGSSSSAMP
ncbi:hypothetical protein ACIPYS_26450 [Kitasatospora sp. NPDC089913]|uniref:hypothetical protein n=1 Tax=Kitasatospora sp. NPDC089913 TaxID=3364080 RepID=UPI00380D8BE1